jgi:hypothetical protein
MIEHIVIVFLVLIIIAFIWRFFRDRDQREFDALNRRIEITSEEKKLDLEQYIDTRRPEPRFPCPRPIPHPPPPINRKPHIPPLPKKK